MADGERFPIDALVEHITAVGPIGAAAMVTWLNEQFTIDRIDLPVIVERALRNCEPYAPGDEAGGWVIKDQTPVRVPGYAVVEWSPEDLMIIAEQQGVGPWSRSECIEWLLAHESQMKSQLNDDGFAIIKDLIQDER